MPEILTGYAAEVIEGYRNEVSRLLAILETTKTEATARERQRIRQLAMDEAKRQPVGGTYDSTEKTLLAFADLLDGERND